MYNSLFGKLFRTTKVHAVNIAVCTSIPTCQSGHRPFALAAEHGCVEMLEMLMDQYNMATMKPNKVCVDLFMRFWFVCIYLQHTPAYAHVCLSAHLCVTPARKLKVKHSLMRVVSLPPFCQRGDTPLHLAARNDRLDAVQLLLQSFDTRDEVNMVDNQCKHRLYHGLVCVSVCSLANPQLDGGSTLDSLRCIEHVLVTISNNGSCVLQDRETALYQAADNGQERCVLALLEAGCDPNILTTV